VLLPWAFFWAVEADDAGYQKNRARDVAQLLLNQKQYFITLEIYERYRHVHKYAQSMQFHIFECGLRKIDNNY
jgi:hypothetical protein